MRKSSDTIRPGAARSVVTIALCLALCLAAVVLTTAAFPSAQAFAAGAVAGTEQTDSHLSIHAVEVAASLVFGRPTVTSLSPTSGSSAGGTWIFIKGINLTGATGVKFGTTACSRFVVDSSSQIRAKVPAHTNGTVDVTVTTPGGTSATTWADRYTWYTDMTAAAPTVTSLSATFGSPAGGTWIFIKGANLTGATGVKFGTTSSSRFVVDSSSQIRVKIPAHAAGTVDVRVTTPGGTSATTSADRYTYGVVATSTRYEQNDTHIVKNGNWSDFTTTLASGGSYGRANSDASSVTVSFNGTYLAWIATQGTTLGQALVSLDGGKAVSVNLARSSVAYQQNVWNTGTLASGTHTIEISRDTSNASGQYISVDAFDVTGSLLDPPPGATSTTGKTYYVDATGGNDNNDGLSPSSPWKTLAKITSYAWSKGFHAGDMVLFKRGQVWREPFILDSEHGATGSGAAGTPITFDAYGTGAKPVFSGSVDLSSTAAWVLHSGNIWRSSGHPYDIGNVLFNGEASNGNKKSALSAVTAQGDFYYNASNDNLYMYSASNPGSFYSQIEACQKFEAGTAPSGCYITGVHNYVTIRNIAIKNYAYHGLVFGNGSSHVTIENCDFSWLGGGYDGLSGSSSDGNGIMIWDSASYITIRNCTFRDIWETAVSMQASGASQAVNHIYIYGNTITRCNAAFDYWLNTSSSSKASELYWCNNTAYNIGGGFFNKSGRQTQYPVGFSIASYSPPTNAHIMNNIFDTCASTNRDGAYVAFQSGASRTGWSIDYNCYYADKASAFKIGGTSYTYAAWKAASGKDAHSKAVNPLLVNPAGGDFHLTTSSPCIGAGVSISGITASGSKVNIGAY